MQIVSSDLCVHLRSSRKTNFMWAVHRLDELSSPHSLPPSLLSPFLDAVHGMSPAALAHSEWEYCWTVFELWKSCWLAHADRRTSLDIMNRHYDVVVVWLQHQQQVAAAVERAKQITVQELNAIIGVFSALRYWQASLISCDINSFGRHFTASIFDVGAFEEGQNQGVEDERESISLCPLHDVKPFEI